MVQGYILTRLDELRDISKATSTKLDELHSLLQALPAVETTSLSFASRLQSWLPLLQQLGAMATKHVITGLVIAYMLQGGSSLTAAELLLKLL